MIVHIHDLDSLTVGDLTFTIAPPSDRSTLEITVDRDASLILRAPARATRARAEKFVESKRQWVYRKLAEKDALVGPPLVKQFVDGEGFAYLGRNYRLLLDATVDDVRLDRGRFVMPPGTAQRGFDAMRRWYTASGQTWLRHRAEPWINRLALSDIEIVVLDLGHRWGSARQSRINIHWASLQLPSSLIDYILVHELAHLRHANHSAEFWDSVSVAMPDYEGRRDSLRYVGRGVWLGCTSPAPEAKLAM